MIRKTLSTLSSNRRTALAAGLFALLAFLMTWPLPLHMTDSVIGWMGDNFYYVWLIGWFQRSLLVLCQSPLSVPFLNYPEGWNLAYTEIAPAMVLIAMPFSVLGGPVLGYNVSLLLSFVLSGLGVYLWVRRLSGSSTAAVVAGAIFAFCPYRMSHLLGHLNLMGTQWFPFYFMSLGGLIGGDQPRRKYAIVSAALLGLIAFTSQYYLYMTLIATAIFVGAYWFFSDRKSLWRREDWKALGLFVAVSLPVLFLSVLPFMRLSFEEKLPSRSLEAVRRWSASPTDLLLPSPRQLVWRSVLGKEVEGKTWVETTLYLGLVALALAGIAFFRRKEMGSGNGQIVKVLGVTGAATFVLALGTDLHWMGRPVTLPEVLQGLSPFSDGAVPLPGYILFRYLPFYDGMRVWMRYGLFVSLFVSVLAGAGTAALLKGRSRPGQGVVGLIVLVAVLLDYFPGFQSLTRVSGRSVDGWLASQPGPGAIVQFPAWELARPEQAYYASIHGKPSIGGAFASYPPPQFRRIYGVLQSFPDPRSMALMRELGVRWIVVDSQQYGDFGEVERGIEALGLRRAGDFDGEFVYEMR